MSKHSRRYRELPLSARVLASTCPREGHAGRSTGNLKWLGFVPRSKGLTSAHVLWPANDVALATAASAPCYRRVISQRVVHLQQLPARLRLLTQC